MDEPTPHQMRRSGRSRRVDYKKLADGPTIPCKNSERETWSTKKLFQLEILDAKEEDGVAKVLVHYIGWDKKYDEWRQVADIVDIPEHFVSTCPAATTFFYCQLRTLIREHLNIHRKVDSLVSVQVPIQKNAFQDLESLGKKHPNKKGWLTAECNTLDTLLGEKWHYRVVNSNKDFAFIVDGTVIFRLKERPPMIDYSDKGQVTFSHRGFLLEFCFVKERGNALDLDRYLRSA